MMEKKDDYLIARLLPNSGNNHAYKLKTNKYLAQIKQTLDLEAFLVNTYISCILSLHGSRIYS